MNTVVFTSIFGQYDSLIEPIEHSDSIDYVCFTDNPDLVSNVWQIKVVDPYFQDDMIRSARHHKICPHRYLEQYDFSLYVDGNMRIRLVPDVMKMLNGNTIAMEWHRKRRCLYVEAEVCKERHLDDSMKINRQVASYRAMGFPENAGLYASYMIVRKHNDERLKVLSESWWTHVCAYSRRDQISLPVVFNGHPVERILSDTRRRLVTIMGHRKR